MPVTNFQPGTILYAANLNTAFANSVNIAGDTMSGILILSAFRANNLSYANGGIITPSSNVAGMNVFTTVTSAFTQANSANILAQAAFNRANTGGAAGGVQTILTANGITVNTGISLSVTGNNTVIFSANLGNTIQAGIVQLNDTITSTSILLAATANSVNTVWATANAAFSKANGGVASLGTETYISSNGITVNSGTSLVTTGNGTVLISANIGNTTQQGIVQLNDTFISFLTTQAATTNVANTIWTTAVAAFNKANAGGGAISQNFITQNGLTVNTGVFLNTSGNNSIIFAANNSSVTQPGIVQLNDTVTSTSVTQAATANALSSTFNTAQGAFNAANAGFSGLSTTYIGNQGITINNSIQFSVTGSGTISLSANTGTTNQPGIIQLNDTVISTSAILGATANAVNTVWSTAAAAFNKANLNGPGITTTFITANGLTVNNVVSFSATGNTTLILSANTANATQKGIVQLNDTVTSNSTILAATANSVNTVWAYANAAFKVANGFAGGITTTYFSINGVSVNGGSSLIVAGSGNPVFAGINASATQIGVVQLNDTITSSNTNQAATANSVNAVSKVAVSAVLRTGDTMSGALTVNNNINVNQTLTVTGNSYLGPGTIASNGTVSLGNQANTKGTLGRFVFASGNTVNTGDTQFAVNMLYRKATTGAAAPLTSDGQNQRANTYGSLNFINLSNNSVFILKGHVAGRDTVTNITKVWSVEAVVKQGLGPSTLTFVTGSPIINVIADDDPLTANWLLNVNLDKSNGGVLFVTSGTSNTTNWLSKIETIELA